MSELYSAIVTNEEINEKAYDLLREKAIIASSLQAIVETRATNDTCCASEIVLAFCLDRIKSLHNSILLCGGVADRESKIVAYKLCSIKVELQVIQSLLYGNAYSQEFMEVTKI